MLSHSQSWGAQAFRSADKALLASAMQQSRALILSLFEAYQQALEASNFVVPYHQHLNPPLWELGHVGWFQERWISRNQQRTRGVLADPKAALSRSALENADSFFDSSTVAHRSRWTLPLPKVDSLKTYLSDTLERNLAILETADESVQARYFFWLCSVHEDMHAEAFAYMARSLGINIELSRLTAGYSGWQQDANSTALETPTDFAFDNEHAAAQLRLEAVDDLDKSPVSWAQFKAFYESADYHKREYWSGGGWEWKLLTPRGAALWRPQALDNADANSPVVHVNFWQAQAWCLAHQRILPTENQWLSGAIKNDLQWGQVWEWTSSNFDALSSDFVAHPYTDYSQPWFGTTHRVLKGGSLYTHPRIKHLLYRNFFTPNRGDMLCGFRSCKA